MRIALKEWAVVAEALGRGDQILILRKGGIREGPQGFQMDYSEFFVFPTLFHQQRDLVLPLGQQRFDEISSHFPPADRVRIELYAQVVSWRCIESLDAARRLEGQHIWRPSVIDERFDWGKSQGIFALACRVHRLPQSVECPMRPEYGGCKSWTELAEDIPVALARPVLEDSEFTSRLRRFEGALANVVA